MYDHSVRVPWIISGPNIPKQKKISAPIYLQDVMATALEIGGAKKPEHVQFESVMPHIHGGGKARDVIYSCYMNKQRMVATKQYKLITYPQIQVELLFDLKADPEEMKNLSENPKYASVMKDMQKRLNEQMKSMNDPLVKKSAH
jgi:choline-sulfatase